MCKNQSYFLFAANPPIFNKISNDQHRYKIVRLITALEYIYTLHFRIPCIIIFNRFLKTLSLQLKVRSRILSTLSVPSFTTCVHRVQLLFIFRQQNKYTYRFLYEFTKGKRAPRVVYPAFGTTHLLKRAKFRRSIPTSTSILYKLSFNNKLSFLPLLPLNRADNK